MDVTTQSLEMDVTNPSRLVRSEDGVRATVSVVDGDAGVRNAIIDMLLAGGYHAIGFATPTEFLEARLPSRPHCLVLDLLLSELAGAELQGKFAGRSRNIPIVFMTASGDTIIGLNSTKHGEIDCLVRPFTAENLFAAVERALLVDARTLAVPGS